MFDYFYGIQSEQFAFYRIPKILFTDDRFRVLSAEAKTLYGILLDRVTLSAKNGWIDQQGRVYIIYTIEEIMADMNCGNKKAIQLLSDLEEKVGLIERKRQGLGKPNLIYVKNFISVESHGEGHFLNCQKHTSGNAESTSPEMAEGHRRNTDTSNTENTGTGPSVSNTLSTALSVSNAPSPISTTVCPSSVSGIIRTSGHTSAPQMIASPFSFKR